MQHLMLLDGPVGKQQGLLEEAREVGGAGDGLGQAPEEAPGLPRDDVTEELVAPAWEVAVDSRP